MKPEIKINIISLIRLAVKIRKLIRQLRREGKMCFKWFKKEEQPYTGKTALLFAINDYPGSANDLRGCLNDQDDLAERISKLYPDFVIKKFSDSKVTTGRFEAEISRVISKLRPDDILLVHYSGHGTTVADTSGDEDDLEDEALYLYNGVFTDDRLGKMLEKIPAGATVILMLDSCFSGTITRGGKRVRFIPNSQLPPHRRKSLKRLGMRYIENHIVFSGCGEDQTSADAFFDGRSNGAFTYYALKTLRKSYTYRQWFEKIRTYLPNETFDQAPTLEGPEDLLNKQIFT